MSDNNQKDIKNIEHRIESWLIPTGNLFVSLFHRIALFAIGAATVWAAGMSFFEMM
ncbi:MAG: phosphate-starvation-inducible protein PsiE, partial [Burkholderiaceae bacterium]|nr:phosphate-starvation-inducible protein PsiE [Burkholderiaceae bacterium]